MSIARALPRRRARRGELPAGAVLVDAILVDAVLLGAVLAAVALHGAVPSWWRVPTLQAWTTVFAAICIQASPYVLLGVALSTAIALVPGRWLTRALPRRAALAVPVATLAGCALPGCECGSVPLATSLLRRGASPGPAFAVMLSAPAANPVVLAATAAAYPGRPEIVLARWCASVLLALGVGWFWSSRPPPQLDGGAHGDSHEHDRTLVGIAGHAAGELAGSLGMLTIGAACAAGVGVLVPRSVLGLFAADPLTGVAALGVLAVLLAVCSAADAFVASSLTQFSVVAQLTFMVVGPAVDVKLAAMQAGAFGGRFAARLGLLTFALAVPCAVSCWYALSAVWA